LIDVWLRPKSGDGLENSTRTSPGREVSIRLRFASAKATAPSSKCWNERLTASASNGVPSWNFTPLRNLNDHSLPSGLNSQAEARPGSSLSYSVDHCSSPS
jgi:hypothetical protein